MRICETNALPETGAVIDLRNNSDDNSNMHAYNPKIFDGIFKLDYERYARLFIPVVNELFGLNLSENAEIRREPTEIHYQDKDKAIRRRNLDSLFRINSELYHIECESKNDSDIVLRIADYDMAIVIGNAYESFKANCQELSEPLGS